MTKNIVFDSNCLTLQSHKFNKMLKYYTKRGIARHKHYSPFLISSLTLTGLVALRIKEVVTPTLSL